MTEKSDTVMTLTFRGWMFAHDGKWLSMKKGQTSFTISGATIEMKDMMVFAQGWVAAELFLGEE